jgi:hypothetical protein
MTEKSPTRSTATVIIDSVLPLLNSGKLSVSANSITALSVDCQTKSISVDERGVEEVGFALSQFIGYQHGVLGLIRYSFATAKRLTRMGWTITLYDNGRALTMGSKVSRWTGHVLVNPLKLRGLLKKARPASSS